MVLSGRTMAALSHQDVAGLMILTVPAVEVVRKMDSLSGFQLLELSVSLGSR